MFSKYNRKHRKYARRKITCLEALDHDHIGRKFYVRLDAGSIACATGWYSFCFQDRICAEVCSELIGDRMHETRVSAFTETYMSIDRGSVAMTVALSVNCGDVTHFYDYDLGRTHVEWSKAQHAQALLIAHQKMKLGLSRRLRRELERYRGSES